ncbi:MAG TPA: ferrous iron transport protein B [Candidatus Polarisedimenticolaceae bacterium]|nr:ferrous iron transport protein B [Candidatus Polarisedimenticolaceae bacterium]
MSEALLSDDTSAPAPSRDGVILVGNPNVGKSAMFGALTGRYVTVSNYPGTTVEITRGHADLGGARIPLIDTPGTNSFAPSSDDERVTRDVVLSADAKAVLAVGDAKNLERTLLLALQLGEMERPLVLALNMWDEVTASGWAIDPAAVADALGVEAIPTVAITGAGLDDVRRALAAPRCGRVHIDYPAPIETAVAAIAPRLSEASIAPRALALMILGGGDAFLESLAPHLNGGVTAVRTIKAEAQQCSQEPLAAVINQTRLKAAWEIAARVRTRAAAAATARHGVKEILERAATHSVWGLPVLAGVLFLAYEFVGVLGAKTLVDLLENGLFNGWINPAATRFFDAYVPWTLVRDLFVGPYGVLTMALTYSLALVFPIVGTFFIAFGVLEDSGYLPRLAVMVNRVFKKMGLNGKAVLPMVLGLGCDTMATLTTRILETRKERLIVILLLALGVPCSAQLTVVLSMLGALSPVAMLIWLGIVIGTIVGVGALAARVIPGKGSDFVLELPPLRIPRTRNILVKTVARIEWYLKEAVPLFVLGTLILFVADRLDLLRGLERACGPFLGKVLGLPQECSEAFIVGFLRRDFGAAGLYHMAEAGRLDPVQVVVAVVVITLFIPCIANFFMMVRERGLKTGAAIAAFIFPFAIAVGAALNWTLRAFHISLR